MIKHDPKVHPSHKHQHETYFMYNIRFYSPRTRVDERVGLDPQDW